MGKVDLPKKADPRDPTRALFTIILTLLVLGWFIWVLANWPDSVVSGSHATGNPRSKRHDQRMAEGIPMQVSGYRSLLLHMEWADALTWSAVLGAASMRQDRPLRERLHHLHSTQWAYLQVLRGLPLEIPELTSFPDLASVGRWALRLYRELASYRSGLDEAQLRQVVQFPWAAEVAKRFEGAGPATVGESILQVALHTTYHRGQVATRLRESGGEPPLTDFIAWIWMQRPAPRWGSLEAV